MLQFSVLICDFSVFYGWVQASREKAVGWVNTLASHNDLRTFFCQNTTDFDLELGSVTCQPCTVYTRQPPQTTHWDSISDNTCKGSFT